MNSDCLNCPYHDSCLDKACIKETRHEIDAEVLVNVTAHQLIVVSNCPLHNCQKAGFFPSDIKATVQYGKNLQSMVIAFNTVGAVSVNRTHEILSSVFNIPLSHLHKFDKEYDEIIKTAYEENPLPEETTKKTWSQEKEQGIKFNQQTRELQGISLPIYK